MAERPSRQPRRLTVQQAGLVVLLAMHGAVWLVIAIMSPSVRAVLISLSSYLAALATVGMVLSATDTARPPNDDPGEPRP